MIYQINEKSVTTFTSNPLKKRVDLTRNKEHKVKRKEK